MVTDSPDDLANVADYPTFLDRMAEVFGELRRVLREGRYAVVIVRDAYQDGRYVFTGSDLAARAAGVGLVPKGDLIWYQAGTRLRPYGYPRVVRPEHRPPAHPRAAQRGGASAIARGATRGRRPSRR